MIVPVQRLVEHLVYRCTVKLMKEKFGDAWGSITVDGVCIAGLSESRDVVLNALAWMKERAQQQHHTILQEIAEISSCENLADDSVMPLRRLVLFSSKSLKDDPQRVARMLAASARYFQLCHSHGKYKCCKVNVLPEFRSANVSFDK